MSNHSVSDIVIYGAIAAGSLLSSVPSVAQSWVAESVCPANVPLEFQRCAIEAAGSFDPPRTADGRPNLGGNWMLPGGQFGGAYEDLEAHGGELDAIGGAATVVDPPDGTLPLQPWADSQVEEK